MLFLRAWQGERHEGFPIGKLMDRDWCTGNTKRAGQLSSQCRSVREAVEHR